MWGFVSDFFYETGGVWSPLVVEALGQRPRCPFLDAALYGGRVNAWATQQWVWLPQPRSMSWLIDCLVRSPNDIQSAILLT